MVRVLKEGGVICIIAPRDVPRHRYPVDCYRFDVDGMIALARYTNLELLHVSCDAAPPGASSDWYEPTSKDSMMIALKPIEWEGIVNLKNYTFVESDLDALNGGFISQEEQIATLNTRYERLLSEQQNQES